MSEIISIILLLFILDKVSQILYVKFAKNKIENNHNTRWFFIHAQVNFLIFLLTWRDVKFSLTNLSTVIFTPATRRTTLAYYTAMISHMYHTVIFFGKLTAQDWIHHLSMMGISGTVSYFSLSRVTGVALFFMSGLPGLIDYTLLWGVKMGYIKRMFQKEIYSWIVSFLRGPGCLYSCFLALPYLFGRPVTLNYIFILINFIMTFWNGQYYTRLSCIDYGKKLNIMGHPCNPERKNNCENSATHTR